MPEVLSMAVDFRAPVTWRGLYAGACNLLHWWRNEIAEMLPASWRHRIEAALRRPRIVLDGTVWRLETRDADDPQLALDAALPDDVLRERIARAAPECLSRRLDAVVPESVVLLRHIQLPAAAAQRLRAVVGLQLERLSPLRGDDVRFDCREAGESEGGLIDVEVAIATRAALEAYQRRLENLGLRVAGFETAEREFRFGRTGQRWSAAERKQAILAGLAAALWLAAAAAIPWSRAAEIGMLSTRLDGLRAPAARASASRTKLAQMQSPFAAASARLARPDALDVLRLLTNLMPDGVQLSDLVLEGDAVRLSGVGGDPRRVASALARSGRFRDARPLASAANGSFTIEMRLVAAKAGLR
jgi:general secretion pathway protein L